MESDLLPAVNSETSHGTAPLNREAFGGGTQTMRQERTMETDTVDALVEVAKDREETRRERLETEPNTQKEANLSGYSRGVKNALTTVEEAADFDDEELLEWTIGLENDEGENDWYRVHALTRETAIEKARNKAQDDLGDGYLDTFGVRGAIAE
jgi:hypothetical protein